MGDEEEDGMELDEDDASDTEDKISGSEEEEEEEEEGEWRGPDSSSEGDIEASARVFCT